MEPKLLLSDIASINDCSIQYVHKLIKKHNLTTNKESNRIFVQNPVSKILLKPEIPKKTISIQTVKGGVGKTTIALSLGVRFWLYGAKVLFIDLDQQANLSSTFKIVDSKKVLIDVLDEKKPTPIEDCIVSIKDGLDILPSSLRNATINQYMHAFHISPSEALPEFLKPLKEVYDIIIIDCPPALGDIVTSASLASDLVIAPLDPNDYAVQGAKFCFSEIKTLQKKKKEKIDFKILLNKYDARTILSTNIVTELQKNNILNTCLFDSIIGVSQEFSKSKMDKASIFDTVKQGRACKDIDLLAREVLGWSNEITD